MMLRDRVDVVLKAAPATVVRAGVPAHFGYAGAVREIDRGVLYVEQAQVMLPPEVGGDLDPDVHALRHQGRVWELDGVPMYRGRGDRVHHWTVKVTRAST